MGINIIDYSNDDKGKSLIALKDSFKKEYYSLFLLFDYIDKSKDHILNNKIYNGKKLLDMENIEYNFKDEFSGEYIDTIDIHDLKMYFSTLSYFVCKGESYQMISDDLYYLYYNKSNMIENMIFAKENKGDIMFYDNEISKIEQFDGAQFFYLEYLFVSINIFDKYKKGEFHFFDENKGLSDSFLRQLIISRSNRLSLKNRD